MIFAVVCYMSAFTASSMDLIQTAALDGLQEVQTNTCQQMKWEFVTQFSEILILAFGLHLAIASRNANTQFRVSHTNHQMWFILSWKLKKKNIGISIKLKMSLTQSLIPIRFFLFFSVVLSTCCVRVGKTISRCIDFSWIYCFSELLHFARYLSEFMGSRNNIFNTFSTFTIHQHTDNGSDILAKALVST